MRRALLLLTAAGSRALSLSTRVLPAPHRCATRLHATVEDEVDLCEVLNASDEEFRKLGCSGPRIRLIAEAREAKQGRDKKMHGTVLSHVEALEKENPTPKPNESPLLSGRWRLVFTTSESILGTRRMRPFRPRRRILQDINAGKLTAKNEEWVLGGLLRNSVRAKLEPRDDGATVDVIFKRFGIGWLKLPAPKSARGVLTRAEINFTVLNRVDLHAIDATSPRTGTDDNLPRRRDADLARRPGKRLRPREGGS